VKSTNEVTFCVVDRGTFFPVADRLARNNKVYYYSPSGDGFETVAKDALGHGYPGVETIRDFWPIKSQIDCFVFPDCRDWGLQQELVSQGFPVWGSRRGEELEGLRGVWLDVAKEIGLPMPHTEVIVGLEGARQYLSDFREKKKHIKISRYRGDMETWCADDWTRTRTKLDALAHKWGPQQDKLIFYIQQDLDTDIEGGGDSYNIDGDFPDEVLLGYEAKSKAYFGAVMARTEVPPEIWKPSELVAPILAAHGYRNFFTTEVRVVNGKSYLLDPCCRCPSPAGESQLEMYSNYADIIYYGARGVLIQPEWTAKYCGQVAMDWTGDKDSAASIRVPEKVSQWVKLPACCYSDGAYHFPPTPDMDMGWVVGIGDTPTEVLNHILEVNSELKDQPLHLHLERLVDLIGEINEAREQGMEFGQGHQMPQPAAVLDTDS